MSKSYRFSFDAYFCALSGFKRIFHFNILIEKQTSGDKDLSLLVNSLIAFLQRPPKREKRGSPLEI